MDMDIHLFKVVLGQLELIHAGPAETQGRLGRLLHDIAQLAGEDQVAAPLHDDRLNIENLAAGLGPGQAGGQAGLVDALLFVLGQKTRRPQVLAQGPLGDDIWPPAALGNAPRHFAAHLADLALQVPQP